VPVPALSTSLLEAAVHQLDPERLVTYQGKVLLVLDPTEYEKRSRERGKRGHQMEHIGRVRRSKSTSPTKQSKGHPVQPRADFRHRWRRHVSHHQVGLDLLRPRAEARSRRVYWPCWQSGTIIRSRSRVTN
jgi:hypothetical protein